MRPDMDKVITERPRSHGTKGLPPKYIKQLHKLGLDYAKREPMGRATHQDKEFTDVIGPLRSYVLAQVGRPWSKVLSEISQVLPASGGMSLIHARGHLWEFVCRDVTYYQDGRPHKADGAIPWEDTYVCPKTGLLKKNKHPGRRVSYRRDPSRKNRVITNDRLLQYHRVEWIWYVCKLARLPVVDGPPRNASWNWEHEYVKRDALLTVIHGSFQKWNKRWGLGPILRPLGGGPVVYSHRSAEIYGGKGDLYCVAIWQASKRELREINPEKYPQPVRSK